MDPLLNPFQPGAGKRPSQLFGRDDSLAELTLLIRRTCMGFGSSPCIVYGRRGVGKTVLLNEVQEIADSANTITIFRELSETDSFRKSILDELKRALFRIDTFENIKSKALGVLRVFKGISMSYSEFEFKYDVDKLDGEGDSGTFQSDLVSAMLRLGELAKSADKCVCFIFDELQYSSENDKAGLFAAMHRITQKKLPIAFVCAGLPQLLTDSAQSKSYIERIKFIQLKTLSKASAIPAIKSSLEAFTFTNDAEDTIYNCTQGYPFFIQQLGYDLWNLVSENKNDITEHDILLAWQHSLKELDNGFFSLEYMRATELERQYMYAMASLGSGPYATADLASFASASHPTIRRNLIKKGLIYSTDRGKVDFTVPRFNEYLLHRG